MNWYFHTIKNYTNFKGRARRTEYWMFVLYNMIFSFIAILFDDTLGINLSHNIPFGYIYIVYSIFAFIPNLAVTIRRLHDINKKGSMIFISIIPIVGIIWLGILLARDSNKGENEYGSYPKLEINENAIGKGINVELFILRAVTVVFIFSFLMVIKSIIGDSIGLFHSRLWLNLFDPVFRAIGIGFPILFIYTVQDKSKQIKIFILGFFMLVHYIVYHITYEPVVFQF
jgi:uncharacterized membrane protein YhaH (DUF805 family)